MASYQGPYHGNDSFKSFTKTWHTQSYPEISPSRPELSAAGKVVFITGGGSGIGKATAMAFAQAGAKVVAIFGRRIGILESAAEEISKANPKGTTTVICESADISQRQTLETAFANACTKAGEAKVDIFVSNAASIKPLHPIIPYDDKTLREDIEGNLIGSFNVVQVAVPLLAPKAKVLNISSGLAHINPIKGFWTYASLKIAVAKMFDFLQAEHPDLDIFNIQPGVVESDLNTYYTAQDDANLPGHFNVWIASAEAEFLKGKYVWVNWDVNELKDLAEEIKESMLLRICLNGVPM